MELGCGVGEVPSFSTRHAVEAISRAGVVRFSSGTGMHNRRNVPAQSVPAATFAVPK